MFFTIIVFMFALVMLAIEYLWPRSNFPEVKGWYPRAIVINLIGLSTVFIYGTGAQEWIQLHRLWDANSIGKYQSIISGLMIVTFFNYWWHRLRHKLSFFWLWFHQIHHSAQRLEVITTFYKHPFEAVIDTIFTIPIVYLIAGLNTISASVVLMIMGCIELFYHWNIKTPQWIGYLIQRPESHCIHHQEGLHSYNFSDLPIWDITFGTFKNPKSFTKSCGLGKENEQRLKEMLKGVDVLENRGTVRNYD
jgi:sterol desaturase/sphingolipid hydroxylase (fatty acid hydroxylase superfamily)